MASWPAAGVRTHRCLHNADTVSRVTTVVRHPQARVSQRERSVRAAGLPQGDAHPGPPVAASAGRACPGRGVPSVPRGQRTLRTHAVQCGCHHRSRVGHGLRWPTGACTLGRVGVHGGARRQGSGGGGGRPQRRAVTTQRWRLGASYHDASPTRRHQCDWPSPCIVRRRLGKRGGESRRRGGAAGTG